MTSHQPPSITQYVVLYHQDRRGSHYDFMIDAGEALSTWRLDQPPESIGEVPVACTRLADHRRLYLDYEGPISGDRGHVSRHDRGACTIESADANRWVFKLDGKRVRGRMALCLEAGGSDQWSLSRVDA